MHVDELDLADILSICFFFFSKHVHKYYIILVGCKHIDHTAERSRSPPFVCVVLALPVLFGRSSGYGLAQEELLSPASVQYSLPSPLGPEPYWQEVSSLECAPIATTEEDTMMEMSDVQVWPAGISPSLVTVEDSSVDGSSRADDSEPNTLSLPCSNSLGRPSSGASGASGSIMELEEEEEEDMDEEDMPHELDKERVHASGAIPKTNHNGQAGGQRSESRRAEVAAGSSIAGGARGVIGSGGIGLGASSAEKFSVLTGQQIYAQLREKTGLTRALEHNGDRYVTDHINTSCL